MQLNLRRENSKKKSVIASLLQAFRHFLSLSAFLMFPQLFSLSIEESHLHLRFARVVC